MLRLGAWRLIQHAVTAELQELSALHAQKRNQAVTADVLRNCYLPERDLQGSLGSVQVKIHKVGSKTDEVVNLGSSAGATVYSQAHSVRLKIKIKN